MSTVLYQNALAEAKELKDLAEKNAMNVILESLTPKIKKLIDGYLLQEEIGVPPSGIKDDSDILLDIGIMDEPEGSEQAHDCECQKDDVGSIPGAGQTPAEKALGIGAPVMPMVSPVGSVNQAAGISQPDIEGKVTLDLDQSQLTDDEDTVILAKEHVRSLAGLLGAGSEQFGIRTVSINNKFDRLMEVNLHDNVEKLEKLNQLKVEAENVFYDLTESSKLGVISKPIKKMVEENLNKLYRSINDVYQPLKLESIKKDCLTVSNKAGKLENIIKIYGLDEGAKKIFSSETKKAINETITIYDSLKELREETNDESVSKLLEQVGLLYKEIYQMTKKSNLLTEEELKLILHGMPDGVRLDDLSVEVQPSGDDGSDEMGMDLDDDMDLSGGEEGDDMDSDMGSDMGDGMESGMDDELGADEDLEEADLGIDLELPDGTDSDSVSAKVSGSGMGMDDEMDMDSDMSMEDDMGSDMGEDDEIVEIDESELLESLKMLKKKKLKESADCDVKSTPLSLKGDGPKQGEKQFGGGSSIGEPFVDVDHLSLSESEDDELDEGFLGESEDDDEDEDDDSLEESHSSTRDLVEKVESYKKSAMAYKQRFVKARQKLDEVSLFNSKLVCANKLLNNENLTEKQRVTIINALDEAESEKEVRKLFTTMSEAFSGKKQVKDKQLTESTRVAGGSSRVQKSGGMSTQSDADKTEFGRWGELAGIKD